MKRFLRYLLLILCMMMLGVWGWSLHSDISIGYAETALTISDSRLQIWEIKSGERLGFQFAAQVKPRNDSPLSILRLHMPTSEHLLNPDASVLGKITYVPLSIVVLPLTCITCAVWFRPIRNRLRGKRDVGFAVEPKQPEPVKE